MVIREFGSWPCKPYSRITNHDSVDKVAIILSTSHRHLKNFVIISIIILLIIVLGYNYDTKESIWFILWFCYIILLWLHFVAVCYFLI